MKSVNRIMRQTVRRLVSVPRLIAMLSVFWAAMAGHAQVNTDQVMRVGQNALYFEDYVLSIQYFNQAIASKPYLAQPYLLRAIAKINLDDYAGAQADASKALELNPFLPDAWEVRGVARQNLGLDSLAILDYDEVLRLLPRNRQILFNKAMALGNTERYAEADTTFGELLAHYPGFDNGYLGRAKLHLAMADTLGASRDIDKALSINKNAVNGYILRAAIAMEASDSLRQAYRAAMDAGATDTAAYLMPDRRNAMQSALADMNSAIKLEPKVAGLYINRAYMRYSLDDYFGAMADYDYALQLEPLNMAALYNRSLLLMEVSDNDRALVDLTTILNLDPDDYRARYNRAVVYNAKRDYTNALADIQIVIDRFPDLAPAYYLRSEIHRERDNVAQYQRDYLKAMDLARHAVNKESETVEPTPDLIADAAARRFNNLLTIENDTHIDEEYNNSAIRGRVQDRNLNIEIEPLMELSYYSSPTELRQNTYYIKEVDDINASRTLRMIIVVTNRPPQLTDPNMIGRHFSSIDYYNSYLSTHAPRAIDYMGRAMDFYTVKNYPAASEDLNRAIALAPDQAVLYFLRSQIRYMQSQSQIDDHDSKLGLGSNTLLTMALDDIDKAIELSPRMAMAWYNKGNLLTLLGDYTSAIASYTRAIELQPDMGEAYYNRGYVYLKLGNNRTGIADLSKAGELGIVSAYNLIKRINN